MKRYGSLLFITTFLILASCGGGGGGSSTPSVSSSSSSSGSGSGSGSGTGTGTGTDSGSSSGLTGGNPSSTINPADYILPTKVEAIAVE